MRHVDKILSEITGSDLLLQYYVEGATNLEKSRVIEYLRASYVPIIYNLGANVHVNSSQAAFSAGYNKALDDILDFREQLISSSRAAPKDIRPDFGAEELAVARGHLTTEEANAAASGNTVRYDPKTGRIKPI